LLRPEQLETREQRMTDHTAMLLGEQREHRLCARIAQQSVDQQALFVLAERELVDLQQGGCVRRAGFTKTHVQ
jgi:hypothetical protein